MSNNTYDHTPSFFGLTIPTHRTLLTLFNTYNVTNNTGSIYSYNNSIGNNSNHMTTSVGMIDPYFPYEPLIAAISIVFFRMTVKLQSKEPIVLRWLFCIVLGILAYTKQSYQLITAVELFSYTISYLLLKQQQQYSKPSSTSTNDTGNTHSQQTQSIWKRRFIHIIQRLLSIAFSAVISMSISHILFTSTTNPVVIQFLYNYIIPSYIVQFFLYLFPIMEIHKAYTIMNQLSLEKTFFQSMIHHLFFVTFHIQVGMGFLGISFLRAEQSRRNQLIRLDVYDDEIDDDNNNNAQETINHDGTATNNNNVNGVKQKNAKSREKQMSEKSRIFQRGAAPFSTFHFHFLLIWCNHMYDDSLTHMKSSFLF
jgi:hypothetical protein